MYCVAFYGSSDGIQFVSGYLDMLDVLMNGGGEGLSDGREVTEMVG